MQYIAVVFLLRQTDPFEAGHNITQHKVLSGSKYVKFATLHMNPKSIITHSF